jgi:hypothetical protein
MSSADEEILAELRRLRNEMAHLRRVQVANYSHHGWLRYVVKDLETNPHTQYKVHFWGAIYWLLNFPAVTVLFFFAPSLWLKLGIFITLVYSIYANFATDYGAMSSAMAAFDQHSLPEIPGEPAAIVVDSRGPVEAPTDSESGVTKVPNG